LLFKAPPAGSAICVSYHNLLLKKQSLLPGTGRGRVTAIIFDDLQDQFFLDRIFVGNLTAGGIHYAGLEYAFRLVLKAQDAGMDDLDLELMLFPAVIDEYLVWITDDRGIIGYEIETTQRNIFNQKFLAVAEFTGDFFGQFEVPENRSSWIKTLMFSFYFH
jgi:hypothetical protein